MTIKKNKENCIICGKETAFLRQQHISTRKYYIYGAGQLCQQCYESLYGIPQKNKY